LDVWQGNPTVIDSIKKSGQAVASLLEDCLLSHRVSFPEFEERLSQVLATALFRYESGAYGILS
jgi:hypothetical protein